MTYLAYRRETGASRLPEISPEHSFEIWRPGMTRVIPASLGMRSSLWWLFRISGVFENSQYLAVLARSGRKVIHRSCVVPKYFRWPFMRPNEVQVSSTWTDPAYRGRGLATAALLHIVSILPPEVGGIWYVTREDNAASISVCRKAGFEWTGVCRRTDRLGLALLGRFEFLPLSQEERFAGLAGHNWRTGAGPRRTS